MQFNQLLTMMFSVIGTIALVFYTYPILGVIFVPIGILYYGPYAVSPFLLEDTVLTSSAVPHFISRLNFLPSFLSRSQADRLQHPKSHLY